MTSTSSVYICPASLVAASSHSASLIEVLTSKITRSLIDYSVQCTLDTVNYSLSRSPDADRGRPRARQTERAQFTTFVTDVLMKAEVTTFTLLAALVFILRAKPYLELTHDGRANEHVFLGGLILAHKYCNDSTLCNKHWAICAGCFTSQDIGRIEREFLQVLDYELGIKESDILLHYNKILGQDHSPSLNLSRTRNRVASPGRSLSPCWSSSDESCFEEDDRTLVTPDSSPRVPPFVRVFSSSSTTDSTLPLILPPTSKTSKGKGSQRAKSSSTVSQRLSSVFGVLRAIRS